MFAMIQYCVRIAPKQNDLEEEKLEHAYFVGVSFGEEQFIEVELPLGYVKNKRIVKQETKPENHQIFDENNWYIYFFKKDKNEKKKKNMWVIYTQDDLDNINLQDIPKAKQELIKQNIIDIVKIGKSYGYDTTWKNPFTETKEEIDTQNYLDEPLKITVSSNDFDSI